MDTSPWSSIFQPAAVAIAHCPPQVLACAQPPPVDAQSSPHSLCPGSPARGVGGTCPVSARRYVSANFSDDSPVFLRVRSREQLMIIVEASNAEPVEQISIFYDVLQRYRILAIAIQRRSVISAAARKMSIAILWLRVRRMSLDSHCPPPSPR